MNVCYIQAKPDKAFCFSLVIPGSCSSISSSLGGSSTSSPHLSLSPSFVCVERLMQCASSWCSGLSAPVYTGGTNRRNYNIEQNLFHCWNGHVTKVSVETILVTTAFHYITIKKSDCWFSQMRHFSGRRMRQIHFNLCDFISLLLSLQMSSLCA